MKKVVFRIFGLAAMAALMVYNVEVFEIGNSADITLTTLANMAVAQSEGGSNCVADEPGECSAEASCRNDKGETTSTCCVGKSPDCSSGTWWVDCGYGTQSVSCI